MKIENGNIIGLREAMSTLSEWCESEDNMGLLMLLLMNYREEDGAQTTSEETLASATSALSAMSTQAALWTNILNGNFKICDPQDGEMACAMTKRGRKFVEAMPTN